MRRRLGSGAYGVVYEALDRQHEETVALKVLKVAEADALYRFKRGFRALTDLRHPNLAELYELHHDEGRWYFSMELIDGQDVVTVLRGDEPQFPPTWDDALLAADIDETEALEMPLVFGATPEWPRVRAVFLQLARGLHALHQNGRLHRDIKPSNVLVTRQERVVLLDFGLIGELESGGELDSGPTDLVGTPAFMSPEQARGESVGPPADWYAAGVVLFQTITGRLPFEGSPLEVLTRKQEKLEFGIQDLVSDVPDDLADLVERLLEIEPEDRPTGQTILQILGDRPGDQAEKPELESVAEAPFVGRRIALEGLEEALRDSRREAVTVLIRGRSGIGKSALIQEFLLAASQPPVPPMVLSGRCHLQESVPYKALDPLVDALTRRLNRWPAEQVEGILPEPDELRALTRVFPVLLRVPQISQRRGVAAPAKDPRKIRRRAARALRELLAGVGRRTPLVLVLDDLHWGDLDSLELLDDVLRPRHGPKVLVLAGIRSEDASTSPFLQSFQERRGEGGWSDGDVRSLELEGLDRAEATELVRAYELDPDRPSMGRLLQESGGSPLLLAEVARWMRSRDSGVFDLLDEARSSSGEEFDAGTPFRQLLRTRLRDLSSPARKLLEAIALAGQPVDVEVVRRASMVTSGGARGLVELRGGRWIRERLVDERRRVEVYHDRVREVVVVGLEEDATFELHRRLAVALEASGSADPETLATHYRAIGEHERAAEYATEAAERAERALAFDRAARLWRLVLALAAGDDEERYRIQVRLGDALAHCGRSREAADAFLEAVGRSGRVDPIEIQRDAAEKLLVSGHIDRGLAVLRHVLRTVGMELFESPTRTLLDLWWQRLRLRIGGLRFRVRDHRTVSVDDQRRMDICWSVEIGLCLVDVLHAAQFHARHLRMALLAGDPRRVARGLAMEVFFGTMEGIDVEPALQFGEELAREHDCSYAAALALMAQGMRSCSQGRWIEATPRFEEAQEALLETGRGVSWELDTIQHFRIIALRSLGRWTQLFTELPELLKEARDRGDLYLEIHLRQWGEALRLLVEDRPEPAAGSVRRMQGRWSYEGFHVQHFGTLYAQAEIHLYEERGLLAWEAVREAWPALTGSMVQRIEMVLVQSLELRGRCALAAAREIRLSGGKARRLLATVEKCARRLRGVGTPWCKAHAAVLTAGAAHLRGWDEVADAELARAEVRFLEARMDLHAAAVRRVRRGLPDSPDLLDEIGAVAPDKLVAVLVPGFETTAAPQAGLEARIESFSR